MLGRFSDTSNSFSYEWPGLGVGPKACRYCGWGSRSPLGVVDCAKVGLERTNFLAPPEPDLEIDDLEDETEEEAWPENPVLGAEELLRFSRLRQLLQP